MLDVHPPEHAAHNWRDFLIHIATIVVGLLIAIGLEQSVEFFHHRHLVHTAEENLRTERADNRADNTKDQKWLDSNEADIVASIHYLQQLKAHQPLPQVPRVHWAWDGTQSAAWDTATASGALALMSYEDVQHYAIVYGQQKIVNDQSVAYVHDIYAVNQPLYGDRKISDLTPTEIDQMIHDCEHALIDLRQLRDYAESLDRVYDHNPPL